MLLPLVSTSGVTPSLLYRVKLVPAGKLLAPKVTSNVSVPLPVLVTMLVKGTRAPGLALATVEPVRVTPPIWVTVNGTVFDVSEMIAPVPSLKVSVAVLFSTPGATPALTFTLKVIVPDWPGVTWLTT